MAEFKLGRIRFIWKDEWTEAPYYKDDVVRYGGKTFMCVLGHIAQTDFMLDLKRFPHQMATVCRRSNLER